nr:hypothetical protein CFP56_56032 [Quercus suber]
MSGLEIVYDCWGHYHTVRTACGYNETSWSPWFSVRIVISGRKHGTTRDCLLLDEYSYHWHVKYCLESQTRKGRLSWNSAVAFTALSKSATMLV